MSHMEKSIAFIYTSISYLKAILSYSHPPSVDMWHYLKIFCVVMTGDVSATGIWWVEVKDAKYFGSV